MTFLPPQKERKSLADSLKDSRRRPRRRAAASSPGTLERRRIGRRKKDDDRTETKTTTTTRSFNKKKKEIKKGTSEQPGRKPNDHRGLQNSDGTFILLPFPFSLFRSPSPPHSHSHSHSPYFNTSPYPRIQILHSSLNPPSSLLSYILISSSLLVTRKIGVAHLLI